MNSTEARCGASRRCRRPVVFNIVIGSWPLVSCEGHLGTLASRLLAGSGSGQMTVTRRETADQ